MNSREIFQLNNIKWDTSSGLRVLMSGQIFFIDKTNNQAFKQFLIDNLGDIRAKMKNSNRDFIFGETQPTIETLRYQYPFFSVADLEVILKNMEFDESFLWELIEDSKYDIGFLSVFFDKAAFYPLNSGENFNEFVFNYLNALAPLIPSPVFYSIKQYDVEEDDETKKHIHQIESAIEILKQTKTNLYIINMLEKMIQNHESEFFSKNSRVFIDKEYNILLPDYEVEIKLPHLTKAIYIFFLKAENSILLTELSKYKSELLEIYKTISYQTSYEKMINSIEELCSHPSKIYPHLSRIKSAFTKQFSNQYAWKYYINGTKNGPKRIALEKTLIYFEEEI